MPRFAANLSTLFTEHAFLDRFAAAAEAGFDAVEFQFPYATPKQAIAERLARHSLSCVLHNMPPGDWAAGERGIAIFPDRVREFRDGVDRAIDYAATLGCTRINCLAGLAPPHAEPRRLHDTLVENLAFSAPAFARAGILLLLEAINTRDMPGFFLSGTRQVLDLIAEVGAPNLRMQYDAYHMSVMGEDAASTIASHLDQIGHVQIADEPGRHEPGTGTIAFPALFERLDRIGYAGWVGAEYRPVADTAEGLGWFPPYRDRPGRAVRA